MFELEKFYFTLSACIRKTAYVFTHFFPERIRDFSLYKRYAKKGKRLYHGVGLYLVPERSSPLLQTYSLIPTFKSVVSNKALTKKLASCFFKTYDLILPVYNGRELIPGLLDSLLKNTDLKYHLWIVDDASPDTTVFELLSSYAKDNAHITLIKNEKNLGFVKSVNKLLKMTTHDVVIVNSDTLYPKNWLSRLVYPLSFFPNIATVTPISNAATMCSFPTIFQDNPLFEGLSVQEIDDVFIRIKQDKTHYFQTPTGVGFCMLLTRKCLNQIGYFDETSFGRGYGEENDWCMRAQQAGFVNYINPHLFVYHQHGGSFLSSEKMQLVKKHSAIIQFRYPTFNQEVQVAASNPAYHRLRNLLLCLSVANVAKKRILVFDHDWGGGASAWLNDKIQDEKSCSCFFTIRYQFEHEKFTLEVNFKEYSITPFSFDKIEDFLWVSQAITMDEVLINELVRYPNVSEIIRFIREFATQMKIPISVVLHDFYGICPSYTLMDYQNQWCNVPSLETCGTCFSKLQLPYVSYADKTSIPQWRNLFSPLFLQANALIHFSEFTKKTYQKAFPMIPAEKYVFTEMKRDRLRTVKMKIKKPNALIRIGIIGAIGFNKGAKLLYEIAELMKSYPDKYHQVELLIVGILDPQWKHPDIKVTGAYKKQFLPELMEEFSIDTIFIPSIWGETFCLTAQEAIEMDMPVVVFNLGAPPERVKNYEKGLVLDNSDASCIDAIIEFTQKMRSKVTKKCISKTS